MTPDVEKIIIDSKRLYKKTQRYLEDISPSLLDRLELYKLKSPLFESFGIESEIEKVMRPLKGLKIGIIDDVLTTGATMSACAKVLKENGDGRSEERRVGKECRSRWSPYH